MRSVADHHVDRPGMQARQRVQSTGTNPPIGLIRSGEGGPQGRQPISRPGSPSHGRQAEQHGKTKSRRKEQERRRERRKIGPATGRPAVARVALRLRCGDWERRERRQQYAAARGPSSSTHPHLRQPFRHPTLKAPEALAKAPGGGFQGLVATARGKHPVPSRTRPLSPAAPMVLRPKTRESRSPPDHTPFSLLTPRGAPSGGARRTPDGYPIGPRHDRQRKPSSTRSRRRQCRRPDPLPRGGAAR